MSPNDVQEAWRAKVERGEFDSARSCELASGANFFVVRWGRNMNTELLYQL